MMKKPHHTQTKLAAKFGATIDHSGVEYMLAMPSAGDAMEVVGHGPDLKALLERLAAANAPAKAPPPARKPAAKKARKALRGRLEGDEDKESEEDVSRSVVKPKYKAAYSKRSIKGTCSDAFAAAFRAETVNEDGDLDIAALRRVASANSVSLAKYTTRNRGWEGRLRMTLGNLLRGLVKKGTDVTIGPKTFKGAKVEK